MDKAVEKGGCRFWIAEDAWPLAEGEVDRDDVRGALIEKADQVEQQLPADLGERETAEFVEDQKSRRVR
jgi:hypothetical protein